MGIPDHRMPEYGEGLFADPPFLPDVCNGLSAIGYSQEGLPGIASDLSYGTLRQPIWFPSTSTLVSFHLSTPSPRANYLLSSHFPFPPWGLYYIFRVFSSFWPWITIFCPWIPFRKLRQKSFLSSPWTTKGESFAFRLIVWSAVLLRLNSPWFQSLKS